jgi:hypothetical protein
LGRWVKHRNVRISRRKGVQTASEVEGMRRAMADVEIDMHAGSGDGTFEKTRNETAVSLR